MKIREEFKVREMAGEHVIVMPGRGGAADMTRIVSLNPLSMYLWEKLRGREFTAADAALLLTERYEVDADTARKVFRLIDALEDSDDVQNVYANVDFPDDMPTD